MHTAHIYSLFAKMYTLYRSMHPWLIGSTGCRCADARSGRIEVFKSTVRTSTHINLANEK